MDQPTDNLTTLAAIETLALLFAAARRDVLRIADQIAEECREVRARHADDLRGTALEAASAKADLKESIEDHKELFEKPRTRVADDVRYGLRKQVGKIAIKDEERTIKLIRDLLPPAQAALLIRSREEVDRAAVKDLTARDLKRLGIKIEDDTDEVVIKALDAKADALIADAMRGIEEAAV